MIKKVVNIRLTIAQSVHANFVNIFFVPYCDKISVNGSTSITGITANGSMVVVVVVVVVAKAVAEVIDS